VTVFEGDEISFLLLLYADVNGSISARHVNFRPLDLISLKPTKEKKPRVLLFCVLVWMDQMVYRFTHHPNVNTRKNLLPFVNAQGGAPPVSWFVFLKRLEHGENEFESLIQTSDRSVPHVLKRAFYPDYPAALNAAVLRIKPSHNNSKSGLILKGIPRTSFVHSIH